MDPRVSRCGSLAPGQIPWCVPIGSSRVRLYPFHWAYNKSNWQYPILKNGLDEFHCCWLRKLGITWRKCWNLVPSDLARVCGAMPWCWYRRKMAACIFVLTFAAWTLAWRRIPTLSPECRRHWESLDGARHFSCLGLKSGFWQIKMEEASKQYTTFMVGNLGFFECNQMPFGLCNTPATFQWLMQNCMGELNLIYCLIYLNDLIVFLQTVEEHLHQLHVIFDWLRV